MKNGLIKLSHAAQKIDAITDYNTVKELTSFPVEPKGKHWHKIEDATALMLKGMNWPNIKLLKGLSYYKHL